MSAPRFSNDDLLAPAQKADTGTRPASKAKTTSGKKRSFGTIELRESGRYRARYAHPVTNERYNAPRTYSTRKDAEAWLASQLVAIDNGTWHPGTPLQAAGPKTRAKKGGITLGEYGDKWITERRNSKGRPLAVRTAAEYRRLFAKGPLTELATEPVRSITTDRVREWFTEAPELGPRRTALNADGDHIKAEPNYTQAGHAYSLLSSIMKTAVEDGLIAKNPCTIRGASGTRTGMPVFVPTVAEVAALIEASADDFRAAIALAAWCSLRKEEVFELRRKDFTIDATADGDVVGVSMHITRAVIYDKEAGYVVKETKSEAGERVITAPSHVVGILHRHLEEYTADNADALLFPSKTDASQHRATSVIYDDWYPARNAVGRPEVTFHALRHFAGTMYALAGATLKENQAYLGHSTVSASMRYQHVVEGRQQVLADSLSKLAAKGSAD